MCGGNLESWETLKAFLRWAVILAFCAPGMAQAARRPAVVGIAEVTLRAADLVQSRQFYGQVLGLAEEAGGNAQHARFRVNGHQYIELIAAGSGAPADRLVEVGFETRDVEGMRRYLGAHGVAVPAQVSAGPEGTRRFVVHDPEGHQIAFVQYAESSGGAARTAEAISGHMIHAGFIVRDRAAEDRFYKNLLGFHVYWHGGMKNTETDWVDMQVPNGTDWLEYMLNVPANPPADLAGVVRHLALGVEDIKPAVKMVEQRGGRMPEPAQVGRDGKWQLNLYDPDLTRVEVMEFRPVEPPCCSKYTGPHPGSR
jgi:catechol 2,3-dioxygenase-like lactoylglutathione lyase family enzyme